MTTIYEKTNGTYKTCGDYELPVLTLPAEKDYHIGVWGQRHRQYLKEHHRVRYYNLLTSNKLYGYLEEVDLRAEEMFLRLVRELSAKANITENLKSTNMMKWVQTTNNVRNRAIEIVNAEVIFVC